MNLSGLNSSDAYLAWDYRVVSSVIWVPLSIIGIGGNLMVILVVMTLRGMKTPTNCYLVSLACADCLFFVSTIPSELSSIHLPDNVFVFGRVGCSLLRFLPYLSINASSLSITAFTVERYIGICHPMKARYICTVKRAQLIIVIIWTFSILYNSTWLFLTDLKRLNYIDRPDAYQCTFSLDRVKYKAIFLIDLFMFYWVPLLLYLILYGVMARTLVKAGGFDLQPSSAASTNGNKVLRHHSTASVGNCVNAGESAGGGGGGRFIKSRKIKSSLDSNSGVGLRLQRTSETERGIAAPASKTDSETSHGLRPSASFSGTLQLTPFDSPLIANRRPSPAASCSSTIRNGNTLLVRRTDSVSSSLSAASAYSFLQGRTTNQSDANSISSRRLKTSSSHDSKAYYSDSLNRSRAQVVKMLIVIVVTFALFCLPYRGLVVYNSFHSNPWIDKWYLLFAKTMVMANSAINPILYNLMSRKFRGAFVLMFKRCFRIRKGPNFRVRQDDRQIVAPRTSLAVAARMQQSNYSATKRRLSVDSHQSSRSTNAVGFLGSNSKKKEAQFSNGQNKKERTTILVPIINLTPDTCNDDDNIKGGDDLLK